MKFLIILENRNGLWSQRMWPLGWLRPRRSAVHPFYAQPEKAKLADWSRLYWFRHNGIPPSPCLYCSHLLNLRSITVAVLSASPANQCESPYLSIPAPTTNNFKAPVQTKMSSVMGFWEKKLSEGATLQCLLPQGRSDLHTSFITVGNLLCWGL